MKSKSQIEDAINLQRGMIRALRSDVRNKDHLDKQIAEHEENIRWRMNEIHRLEERKNSCEGQLEQALGKLQLLKQMMVNDELVEFMKNQEKLEKLQVELGDFSE